MKWFRLVCIGVAAVVAAIATSIATASAGDVVVHSGSCIGAGGNTTVPAGSTISMFGGVYEMNSGLVQDWLNDQTTVVSVNGGPPVDITASYTAPSQSQPFGGAPPGTWLTYFVYPTGITLANPGDTLTFTISVTLAHLLAEQVNGPIGFSLGYTPGTVFFTPAGTTTASCTVTAT